MDVTGRKIELPAGPVGHVVGGSSPEGMGQKPAGWYKGHLVSIQLNDGRSFTHVDASLILFGAVWRESWKMVLAGDERIPTSIPAQMPIVITGVVAHHLVPLLQVVYAARDRLPRVSNLHLDEFATLERDQDIAALIEEGIQIAAPGLLTQVFNSSRFTIHDVLRHAKVIESRNDTPGVYLRTCSSLLQRTEFE